MGVADSLGRRGDSGEWTQWAWLDPGGSSVWSVVGF